MLGVSHQQPGKLQWRVVLNQVMATTYFMEDKLNSAFIRAINTPNVIFYMIYTPVD